MGCSFSCKRLSSSSKFKNIIRIVHLNGYVEEIEYPVTVAEVTGKPPKHLLFTHVQLLSNASTPLKLDTPLERGCVYFLLPYSLFDSNVSPVDLAPLARKLASIARKIGSKSKSGKQKLSSSVSGNSTVWSSPARSPNRQFSDNDQILYGIQKSSKSRSWKPILSTIREISFNRRSESDLQENAN